MDKWLKTESLKGQNKTVTAFHFLSRKKKKPLPLVTNTSLPDVSNILEN